VAKEFLFFKDKQIVLSGILDKNLTDAKQNLNFLP
jgi:hypothetical protein